jgi:antitoxin (DNA-binding transcriptional repressor) of toxin-antitoxin stability system
MKRASVTYTKNCLGRVLGMVREGDTVLVLDRDVPVARIEPVSAPGLSAADHLRLLERRGVVTPPRRRLDAKAFVRRPRVRPTGGASAVAALIAERQASR